MLRLHSQPIITRLERAALTSCTSTSFARFAPTSTTPSRLASRTSSEREPSTTLFRWSSSSTTDASKHGPEVTPFDELRRLGELVARASDENRKTEKASIVSEYPDLKDLLEHIYDRHARTNLTSKGLLSYIERKSISISSVPDPGLPLRTFSTLRLLLFLESRSVTGNEAFDCVLSWMKSHGVGLHEQEGKTLLRVLDRNLKAGFGANTLLTVQWPGERATEPSAIHEGLIHSPGSKAAEHSMMGLPVPSPTIPSQRPATLKQFSPSLGQTILRSELPKLFSNQADGWYASRKYDGVRVLLLVDVKVGASADDGPPKIQGMHTLSRGGKEYLSLEVLKREVKEGLDGWEGLRSILYPKGQVPTDSAQTKTFVIDGECCALIPALSSASESTLGEPPKMIEDFNASVSAVKKTNVTIPHPALFVLDVLSYDEFLGEHDAVGPPFRGRLDNCRAIFRRMGESHRMNVLREVEQVKVSNVEDVEAMMKRASHEGWEGLIIRKDDHYKGKRSRDIRKFKEWHDAEYEVLDVDIGPMRLSVNGVFAEREGVTNVWIEHKGTRVSVGSGFTTEQRIRWAKDPSLIIGKEMTVEYFGESTSDARGPEGGVSLRFPRVKRTWEDGLGRRDV